MYRSHHMTQHRLRLRGQNIDGLHVRPVHPTQARLVKALEQNQRVLEALLEHTSHDVVATQQQIEAGSRPERPTISRPSDVVTLLGVEMAVLDQEQLRVLCLDAKHHVRRQEVIYQGTVTGISIRAAEVLRPAVRENAPAIVVVHNHPSGDPAPSHEDIRATEQLHEACRLLDIELVDHIILGDQGQYASLRELDVLNSILPGSWTKTAA